ncbi:hypothetical protein DF052_00260 [Burkholderia glumae]|uniref:hypothetical protein n=1 Tax=Burkholderia glumae TaxID=337 RepID=UPI000F5E2BA9|nr:hypothetical protein [Burkholderia glumae]RQZ76423.1 hypothetical protein DF052_00260 [Burkholderia glumae]
MTTTNESSTSKPTGMVDVNKDQFFAIMGPLNVHPRAEPDRSIWETPQREMLGLSMPGYASCYGTPERYFVVDRLATGVQQ